MSKTRRLSGAAYQFPHPSLKQHIEFVSRGITRQEQDAEALDGSLYYQSAPR